MQVGDPHVVGHLDLDEPSILNQRGRELLRTVGKTRPISEQFGQFGAFGLTTRNSDRHVALPRTIGATLAVVGPSDLGG